MMLFCETRSRRLLLGAALLLSALLLTACGDDPAPAPEIPPWALVAPEQISDEWTGRDFEIPATVSRGVGPWT
jgi:hypothetical protein